MKLKVQAKLDPKFAPLSVVCRDMREATKENGQDIVIGVERNNGYTTTYTTRIFKDGTVILVGVMYIVFRTLGKYLGARWSAQWSKCSPSIVKWLGVTLLPQAGVSIGMSITAAAVLATGGTVRNIVLFAVMIYELLGPMLTKIALTRAGDITPKPTEPHQHHTLAEVFADDVDEDDTK